MLRSILLSPLKEGSTLVHGDVEDCSLRTWGLNCSLQYICLGEDFKASNLNFATDNRMNLLDEPTVFGTVLNIVVRMDRVPDIIRRK